MGPTETQIGQVRSWLQSRLRGFDVQSIYLDQRYAILFRAQKEREAGIPLELEISYEVFADHSVERILSDLEAHRTVEHLTRRSDVRLMYDHMRRLRQTDRHS